MGVVLELMPDRPNYLISLPLLKISASLTSVRIILIGTFAPDPQLMSMHLLKLRIKLEPASGMICDDSY
jgi:hypothetical protein